MQEEYLEVGKLTKVHGLKGELKFYFHETYDVWMYTQEHFFVMMGNQFIPLFIEHIRGNSSIIKLDGIHTPESAVSLSNKIMYVEKSLVPPTLIEAEPSRETDVPIREGFKVIDQTLGEIGIIKEVIEMPMQILALIDFKGKEVMIPIHEQLIRNIDYDTLEVQLQLPDGILDL